MFRNIPLDFRNAPLGSRNLPLERRNTPRSPGSIPSGWRSGVRDLETPPVRSWTGVRVRRTTQPAPHSALFFQPNPTARP